MNFSENIVQKFCPQHRQGSAIKKWEKWNAREKRYRRNMLPKTPLGIVIDENFSRKAGEKAPIKKTCPKQRQHFSFKRRPYWFSRQKVPCKCSVQNTGKNSLTAKTVLKFSSWFFWTKNLLKSLSTVSKCSSEKHRTKSCPQHRKWRAIKKREKWKARQNVIFDKCYPKHRWKTLSLRTFLEMLV